MHLEEQLENHLTASCILHVHSWTSSGIPDSLEVYLKESGRHDINEQDPFSDYALFGRYLEITRGNSLAIRLEAIAIRSKGHRN